MMSEGLAAYQNGCTCAGMTAIIAANAEPLYTT